jgi:sortase A
MGFADDPLAEPVARLADTLSDKPDAHRTHGRAGKHAKPGKYSRRARANRSRHTRTRRSLPPLSPLRRAVLEFGFALITAGVVVLLFVGYQLWGTGLSERASQNKLKKQFSAPTTVPTPTPPAGALAPSASAPSGEAIAHLVIPKIGVDKYVVDGVSTPQLRQGPGHYPGTPSPGQPGNAAIAGHRTTYGAPFYRLNELQPGDPIVVTTRAGEYHYEVIDSKVVKPTDVSVLDPTPDNRLTLTTCTPRFSASSRLIVISHMVSPPAPPAAAPPVTAPPGPAVARPIDLGSGDGGAWPPVALYGALTVGLWVLVRVEGARARSKGWLIVAVGAVLCLLPLWFVFENVVRLLPPNL